MRYYENNETPTFSEFYRKVQENINDNSYNLRNRATQPKLPEISQPLIVSRGDKIRAAITGVAVGFLAYEASRFLPEESARITLGIAYGVGAAALDGYMIPLIEAHTTKR